MRSTPPPPPLELFASSCVTVADLLAERLLALDVQVIVKVSVSEAPEITGFGSTIVAVPLVGRELIGQPSFEPPPLLAQLVALVEAQVSVIVPPVVTLAGEAVTVTVTAGQLTVTDVCAV
jgi:hypothetical protein